LVQWRDTRERVDDDRNRRLVTETGWPSSDRYDGATVPGHPYSVLNSGVTKVGVTLFFSCKKTTFFYSHRPLQSDDLCSYHLVTTPSLSPSNVVCPMFFANSGCKNLISFGCYPSGWCHPGRPLLVTPLVLNTSVASLNLTRRRTGSHCMHFSQHECRVHVISLAAAFCTEY